MIELTNAENNTAFMLRVSLIELVTDTADGVFVWTDFKNKIGFKVTEAFDDLADELIGQ